MTNTAPPLPLSQQSVEALEARLNTLDSLIEGLEGLDVEELDAKGLWDVAVSLREAEAERTGLVAARRSLLWILRGGRHE